MTILRVGNDFCKAWIAVVDETSVAGRSRIARPDKPCSSRARADVRPRAPAPPVMRALPSMAKREVARSREFRLEIGSRGEVKGFEDVDSVIVGIVRDERRARASCGAGVGVCMSWCSPMVCDFVVVIVVAVLQGMDVGAVS